MPKPALGPVATTRALLEKKRAAILARKITRPQIIEQLTAQGFSFHTVKNAIGKWSTATGVYFSGPHPDVLRKVAAKKKLNKRLAARGLAA